MPLLTTTTDYVADDPEAQMLFGDNIDDDEDHVSMDVGGDSSGDTVMAVMDVLQTLGVEPEHANRYACSIIHESHPPPSLVEVFGTGNIVQMAKNLCNMNTQGLDAFDLRACKPSGQPWGVQKEDRPETCLQVHS